MTPTEARVAQIYAEFIGIGELGPEDDIYQLGADSVLVVRIALELEREFGIELPTGLFESTGSIREISSWIDRAMA